MDLDNPPLNCLQTLMAKLKVGSSCLHMYSFSDRIQASDWTSLDSNLIAIRASILAVIMPVALSFGVAERGQFPEPLKVSKHP